MALFKPFRGSRASLDAHDKHDGYAYFCVDDGTFHIDYLDVDGNLQRKQINAKQAEELIGYNIATTLNSSDNEIPTSQAVLNVLEYCMPIKDVSELPTTDIVENTFMRYTESTEKFYAITSTSKNIIKKEYMGNELTLTVDIIPVDTLPDYQSATSVTNLTDKVTLYYLRSDNTVYGAVNSFVLLIAAGVSQQGWYTPDYIINNYAGVINNVMDAEYGNVYVVHEVENTTRLAYYYNNMWYEIPTNIDESYVPRLDRVSEEKFASTDDANINVHAYRMLGEQYDRVYVEGKGHTGISGDYCLTPNALDLPVDPWSPSVEDVNTHAPSIPVRHADGGISVYTDDNSDEYMAVSKQYFEEKTYQYVRRKPEEAEDVCNANIISAHTWIPDDNLYRRFTESFSSSTVIPAVADATDDTLVAIHSDSNAANSIQITQDGENYVVDCIHPTSAQSKYRFIRQGTKNELVFSTDIKLVPASDITNNRGFTMVAKNSITEDNSIWGGSNLSVEYAKGGDGYKLTFLGTTISFADYVGDWVNLRIEMDSLGKGGAVRLYLNNTLKISGELTASVVAIKSYDFMIYTWNNSNSGFRGNIYFDNMYFGDVPEAVKYAGYDSLTPVAYDYEDESVARLGADTLVLRKTDGSVLTKKELTDDDDVRVAASKHYVDEKVKSAGSGLPTDGMVNGAFLRIVGGKPAWDPIQYAEGNLF